MIQIFSLILAADEAREVAVQGEYFELRNALHPIAMIELLDRTGSVIARLENPEQSDYCKPGRYETIRITNGPIAQTVRHFYGSGDAGSRRTSGLVSVEGTVAVMGSVNVIDGGKARTLAGEVFGGRMAIGPGGVGTYTQLQWWNPAGSGKRLIVPSFVAQAGANGVIVGIGSTALPTLFGAGATGSKKSGGGASIVVGRTDTAAAYSGLSVLNQSGNFVQTREAEPYVILPGFGFNIAAYDANVSVFASIHYIEEANV